MSFAIEESRRRVLPSSEDRQGDRKSTKYDEENVECVVSSFRGPFLPLFDSHGSYVN
jgi:hypothetical protein